MFLGTMAAWALLFGEPAGDAGGEVGDDDVGSGAAEGGHAFHHHAAFVEGSTNWGATLASVRLELVEVESMLLVRGELPLSHDDEERKDAVGAFTLGVQRDVARWKGMRAAVGANGTLYRVPSVLRDTHVAHPASFQVFLQLRPPVGSMGRMWNMRMAGPPMSAGDHAQHQH